MFCSDTNRVVKYAAFFLLFITAPAHAIPVDTELCNSFTHLYGHFIEKEASNKNLAYSSLAAATAGVVAGILVQAHKAKVIRGLTTELTNEFAHAFETVPSQFKISAHSYKARANFGFKEMIEKSLSEIDITDSVFKDPESMVSSTVIKDLPDEIRRQVLGTIKEMQGGAKLIFEAAANEAGLDLKMSVRQMLEQVAKENPAYAKVMDKVWLADQGGDNMAVFEKAFADSSIGKKFAAARTKTISVMAVRVLEKLSSVPGAFKEGLNLVAKSLAREALLRTGLLAATPEARENLLKRIAKRLGTTASLSKEAVENLMYRINTNFVKAGVWVSLGAAGALATSLVARAISIEAEVALGVMTGQAGGGSLTDMYEKNIALFFDGTWTPTKFCGQKVIINANIRKQLMDLDGSLLRGGFYAQSNIPSGAREVPQ